MKNSVARDGEGETNFFARWLDRPIEERGSLTRLPTPRFLRRHDKTESSEDSGERYTKDQEFYLGF